LCWKNFRIINDKLDTERGKTWTPLVTTSDLLQKSGKIAEVIKSLENSGTAKKPECKEMLSTELSNLLFIVFVLSEHYGIELEESFLQTVNDYMLKFIR
jgi:NTP pyrophosphatase (non-canonical NTP hydrolase)